MHSPWNWEWNDENFDHVLDAWVHVPGPKRRLTLFAGIADLPFYHDVDVPLDMDPNELDERGENPKLLVASKLVGCELSLPIL